MRALRRREKGKPAARRGRKAQGPVRECRQPGCRTVVGSVEEALEPHLLAKEWGSHEKEGFQKSVLNRLWWLGALIIASALAVLLVLVAYSPAAQAHHSWGKYHWARTSNPFTLQLGDNVSASWDPLLARASSDWGRSSVLDTVVVSGQ